MSKIDGYKIPPTMIEDYNIMIDDYDDKIKMLNAQMLDNDKKMIVMMLNEVKAILSLPKHLESNYIHDALVKLEEKLFNDLLFAYNIDQKEMRITNGT